MLDFLSSILTWEKLFENLVFSVLIAGGVRAVLWLFKKPIRERLFWIVVPVFVLILLLAAHYVTGGRSRLNEPHLQGSIDAINMAPIPQSNRTTVLLVATLYNSGAPSFADGYSLTVNVPGMPQPIIGAPQAMPEHMTLVNDDGTKATYYGQDALYSKTVVTPIPTGGMARGVLWFILPVNHDVLRPETEFVLSYSDAMRSRHDIRHKLTGVNSTAPAYIPGLRPPSAPSPSPSASPSPSPSPTLKQPRRRTQAF